MTQEFQNDPDNRSQAETDSRSLSQFQRYGDEGEGEGEDHGGVRFVQTRLRQCQVLQIAPGGHQRRICENDIAERRFSKVMQNGWRHEMEGSKRGSSTIYHCSSVYVGGWSLLQNTGLSTGDALSDAHSLLPDAHPYWKTQSDTAHSIICIILVLSKIHPLDHGRDLEVRIHGFPLQLLTQRLRQQRGEVYHTIRRTP
ncbi:hypothetical protein BDV12DRAFT_91168 [Aspergillus spectabilis]